MKVSTPSAPLPQLPTTQQIQMPILGQSPGAKPSAKSQSPSWLTGDQVANKPGGSSGAKTLVGQ